MFWSLLTRFPVKNGRAKNDYLQAGYMKCACKPDLEDMINANPQSDKERHTLFLRKRGYIDDLLEEVVIDGDHQIHVKFRADILRLVQGNKVA